MTLRRELPQATWLFPSDASEACKESGARSPNEVAWIRLFPVSQKVPLEFKQAVEHYPLKFVH